METIKNAILAGTQSKMTLMGVEFDVPVIPKKLDSPKKREKFAEEEALKLMQIINS